MDNSKVKDEVDQKRPDNGIGLKNRRKKEKVIEMT